MNKLKDIDLTSQNSGNYGTLFFFFTIIFIYAAIQIYKYYVMKKEVQKDKIKEVNIDTNLLKMTYHGETPNITVVPSNKFPVYMDSEEFQKYMIYKYSDEIDNDMTRLRFKHDLEDFMRGQKNRDGLALIAEPFQNGNYYEIKFSYCDTNYYDLYHELENIERWLSMKSNSRAYLNAAEVAYQRSYLCPKLLFPEEKDELKTMFSREPDKDFDNRELEKIKVRIKNKMEGLE